MPIDLTLNFQKAKTLLENSSRILLTMHERMDGDDGGSVLAMFHQLNNLGKQASCAIKGGVPASLSFLPGSEHIKEGIGAEERYDLLVTCGCATIERTGNQYIAALNCPVLNFDHHPDNSFFGDVNVVDPEKSSVAELIFDFFRFCRWPIGHSIATSLLTGIITDTGSFMHSNTGSSTLKAAAELLRKGARPQPIIQRAFKGKHPQTLKAWGKALKNAAFDKRQKMIFSVMTEEDLQEIDKLPKAAFEGLVETLNSYPEAKFALFLRQDGTVIKGSLRSRPEKQTDVAAIAKLFGGGGHAQAAGFSLAGKLEKRPDGTWRISPTGS